MPPPTGREVFEILAREHADMLMSFLRSLTWRDDVAEDLFQETMLVAWRRLGDYDRTMPFGPWLRGIAAKLALAHRRKATHAFLSCEEGVLEALEVHYRRFEHRPADSFRQRLEQLSACLDKLPPILRQAVDLVYSRGLPMQAIAAAVDSSEEAVKKRVQRARGLLAQCLQGAEAAP
jgi:RNA polymerase sigma factor (sigma-70 family)